MKLIHNDYTLIYKDGGIEIRKNGKILYTNRRPMYITVKTIFAINEFYDGAYGEAGVIDDKIIAKGVLKVPSGSEFAFEDVYEITGAGFKISRNVKVLKAGDDLGFSTKISFVMQESDKVRDYNCFAPGVWYKQNEFAPDYAMGKDLDCEYFWRMETSYALPLFAVQNIESGEMASLSRWAADVTMRSTDIQRSENNVDRKLTVGSIGISKLENKTLNYMYYGFTYRKEIDTQIDGLSIDYVYPGSDGQMSQRKMYGGLDFKGKSKSFERLNHPVETGFEQNYQVAVNFRHYDSFQFMMRDIWRTTYTRLRDKLFEVDNECHFHNCMKYS